MIQEKDSALKFATKEINLGTISFAQSSAGLYYTNTVYTAPGKIVSVVLGDWTGMPAKDFTPFCATENTVAFISTDPSSFTTYSKVEIKVTYI